MTEPIYSSSSTALERQLSIAGLLRLARRRPVWFLATLTVVATAVLWFVGSQSPSFRSTATLLLRWGANGGESVAHLMESGGELTPVGEMTILRSREVAEAAVMLPDGGAPSLSPRLAPPLATIVYDERFDPLFPLRPGTLFSRAKVGDGWLDADAIQGPAAISGPIAVEFLDTNRVRVGRPGRLFGWSRSSDHSLTDTKIEYEGTSLRLTPHGDVTGRRFLVTPLALDDAIARLRAITDVSELERNSGVIQVTVEDNDPIRAAASANAIANHYIDHSAQRGRRWASRTLGVVDAQLKRHQAELVEVEQEVAKLMREHPRSFDPQGAATSLIQRASNLEAGRVKLVVVESALAEASTLLAKGEEDVLSRLNPELLGPATSTLLQGVADLATDAVLLDRQDDSVVKRGLLARIGDLEKWSEKIAVWIEELDEIVDEVKRGDPGALARLGNTRTIGLDTDTLTDTLLNDLASLRVEKSHLASTATSLHPRMKEIATNEAEVEERLVAHLESRVAGLTDVGDAYRDLLDDHRVRLAAHPMLERGKISIARQRLMAQVKVHLRERLSGIRGHRAVVDDELATIEAQLAALPDEKLQLAAPTRRLETLRETVAFLMKSQQQAEISRTSMLGAAELIDRAAPPSSRTRPKMSVLVLIALLIGMAAAFGLVGALEMTQGAILDAEELTDATSLEVVGSIPEFESSGIKELYLPLVDDPNSHAADAIRSLAATLADPNQGGRTVAVTSSVPGEGKSVLNIDLALAFASGGRKVLLVDGDLRSPSVHRMLKVRNKTGLADVLAGSASWEQVISNKGLPELAESNLWVMPAGKLKGNPAVLLGHERFVAVLREMKEDFDVVVIDVPPVHPVNDLSYFVRHLDGVVFLYRRNGVSRRLVGSSMERIRATGVPLLGAVLNDDVVHVPRSRTLTYARRYQYV